MDISSTYRTPNFWKWFSFLELCISLWLCASSLVTVNLPCSPNHSTLKLRGRCKRPSGILWNTNSRSCSSHITVDIFSKWGSSWLLGDLPKGLTDSLFICSLEAVISTMCQQIRNHGTTFIPDFNWIDQLHCNGPGRHSAWTHWS